MSKKLSNLKIKHIISLHLDGHSHAAIASKLHISQPTVSHYIAEFEALKQQLGVEAALAKYGVTHNVKQDQIVIEELNASDLTIADVNIALQINNLLNACGVMPNDHHDLIIALKKAKESGYVDAALHLHGIEKQTGMSYVQIISTAEKKVAQLKQAEGQIAGSQAQISKLSADITQMEKTKIQASASLKAHLELTGLTDQRILKIEKLAVALKDEGIPDEVITEYLDRLQTLHKTGIKANLFAGIVAKAKAATKSDGGKKLLALLDQYGNLADVNSQLQTQNDYLSKEAAQLEQKAKQKKALEKEISTLESTKAKLQPEVAGLAKEKADLDNASSGLVTANEHLTGVNDSLEQHKQKLVSAVGVLDKEIAAKTVKVKDLDALVAKREETENQLKEFNTRKIAEGRRWQVFEGLMGIIQAKSREELKKALSLLPALLEELDEHQYPTDFAKDDILERLGTVFHEVRCSTCKTSFFIDKPAPQTGYQCPMGSFGKFHKIYIEKDTATVLNEAMEEPKNGLGAKLVIATQVQIIPKPENQT